MLTFSVFCFCFCFFFLGGESIFLAFSSEASTKFFFFGGGGLGGYDAPGKFWDPNLGLLRDFVSNA